MSQFSLFGAAAAEPSLDDLDGVLLAGGHWVRQQMTARLSVVVADRWRADALAADFAHRAVGADDAIVAAADGWSVRSAFTARLVGYASQWSRGANEGPPVGFVLTAGGLRLWAIAAGTRDEVGYLLATDSPDSVRHLTAGAQLSRHGLAAVSLSQRGGPGWRITSTRRIRRLAELLGEPPPGGEDHWPSPSG
jgi:hypothetical protein